MSLLENKKLVLIWTVTESAVLTSSKDRSGESADNFYVGQWHRHFFYLFLQIKEFLALIMGQYIFTTNYIRIEYRWYINLLSNIYLRPKTIGIFFCPLYFCKNLFKWADVMLVISSSSTKITISPTSMLQSQLLPTKQFSLLLSTLDT